MLEHNGKVYARVSDIIKPFCTFGAIDKDVLERKASLGTSVHKLIQQEIDGELPIAGFQERAYFKSFELWRAAIKPVFVMTEKRIYCDHKMLTGCIDALIKLEGKDESILVDWKTSAAESPITWPMQAHLYHYLLTGQGIPVSDRFLFVKLDRFGGLPKVFQYRFDNRVFARCLQAIDDFWKINVATNS